MTTNERGVWLAAAWAEVADIPASVFFDAASIARQTVDHPAKLIPTILRESRDHADILFKRLEREQAAFENRNAPRLARPERPKPEAVSDNTEVAALMSDLVRTLQVSAARGTFDVDGDKP